MPGPNRDERRAQPASCDPPRLFRCLMESVVVEIRAAEGGDDAKLLVLEQLRAYLNAAKRGCL